VCVCSYFSFCYYVRWKHLPAKLHALGLASILSMNPDQMPAAIQENLPTLLARLVCVVYGWMKEKGKKE